MGYSQVQIIVQCYNASVLYYIDLTYQIHIESSMWQDFQKGSLLTTSLIFAKTENTCFFPPTQKSIFKCNSSYAVRCV